MGEYHKLNNGTEIKVGTCESLYYIRADQFGQLIPGGGDLPRSVEACGLQGYRFRFPFPEEDDIAPGDFENYNKGILVPASDALLPGDCFDHGKQVFRHPSGSCGVSLPCPHSKEWKETGLRLHNYGGIGIELVQQRPLNGLLLPVIRCGCCGALSRLEGTEVEALALAYRSEADRLGGFGVDTPPDSRIAYYHKVADRILQGVNQEGVTA